MMHSCSAIENSAIFYSRTNDPSKKGTGFEQPLAVQQHWHIGVSYINISGTFYYLCSILDGCSRYIVNWICGSR